MCLHQQSNLHVSTNSKCIFLIRSMNLTETSDWLSPAQGEASAGWGLAYLLPAPGQVRVWFPCTSQLPGVSASSFPHRPAVGFSHFPSPQTEVGFQGHRKDMGWKWMERERANPLPVFSKNFPSPAGPSGATWSHVDTATWGQGEEMKGVGIKPQLCYLLKEKWWRKRLELSCFLLENAGSNFSGRFWASECIS